MTTMRETVLGHLATVMKEHSPLPVPGLFGNDMLVEDFWLDSLAWTSLFTAIEADTGFIPPEILDGVTFPQTLGELIDMYLSNGRAGPEIE